MKPDPSLSDFESVVLPHLDAAYNLARWLTRSDHDAQDAVQDAYLRAFRGFDSFRGGDARAWLLTIVRNVSYTLLKRNGITAKVGLENLSLEAESEDFDPSMILVRAGEIQRVRSAIESLPVDYREVAVLREIQGMSYKEIAGITNVPMGTVMSRLSRARRMLMEFLAAEDRDPGDEPGLKIHDGDPKWTAKRPGN